MSLSPLVSFKSRFVTYLLNFPRILADLAGSNILDLIHRLAILNSERPKHYNQLWYIFVKIFRNEDSDLLGHEEASLGICLPVDEAFTCMHSGSRNTDILRGFNLQPFTMRKTISSKHRKPPC